MAIPTRPFGRSDEQVSLLAVGGAHLGRPEEAEAIRMVHAAIDAGATFLDNAWEYNDGESERRMGKALGQGGYRDRAFLLTKDWADDPARVFAPGGSIEALVKAKEQGKVRYIGFTGHKHPRLHRQMLEQGFPWDSVQMPLNVLDAHYLSFEREILPILTEQGIAVIGMKSNAGGHLADTGISATEGLRYAMSLPVTTVVSGMTSLDQLQQNLAVADGFVPLSASERDALLARSRPHSADGEF